MKTIFAALAFVCASGAATLQPITLGPAHVGDQVAISVASVLGPSGTQYTWSRGPQMLPGGLIVTPQGALVGTLTASGVFNFMLDAVTPDGMVSVPVTFSVDNTPLGQRILATQQGTKWLWASRAAFAAAQFGDYVSTVKCVELPNHACVESNPVYKAVGIDPSTVQGRDYFMWTKVGITLGVIGFQEFILRPIFHVPVRTLTYGTALGAIIQGGVDWHNTHLTQQIKAAQAGAIIAP